MGNGRSKRDNVASSHSRASTSRGTAHSEVSRRESFLIVTVTENRAREIGICAIDLAAPYEVLLWSIIDSHSYSKTLSLLQAYEPKELLMVESAKPHRVNDALTRRYSASMCRLVPIARKYFDQTKGAEDLRRIITNCVDQNIAKNYVVMAALACTMRFVEFVQGVYIASTTVRVVINPSLNRLLMDHATIAALELVHCARGDSARQSLWGIMNNTQTSAGNRLLRSTMLQPPCHLKTIQNRHEMIELLLGNPGWFFDLMDELPKFSDLDRLLAQLVLIPTLITPRTSRLAIGNVIALKQTLEALPALVDCIQSQVRSMESPCALLASINTGLQVQQLQTMRDDIDRVIYERYAFIQFRRALTERICARVKVCRSAAQRRIQECFAIRSGIDGMLDVARRTYLDTIEKIHGLVRKYNETLPVPVKLTYTSRRGYHLLVPNSVTELPSIITERVMGKKALACSTKELQSLNSRLAESLTAVYKLSNGVIQSLLDKIRPHASALYTMVETIALLDMLLSFTNLVALSPAEKPYVQPRMTADGSMVIKNGRHPIIERMSKDHPFVANSTFFDASSTYHIITGPNCAGKSTYMKTLAVVTILAHMGSYVPAEAAFVPLRDRILTRFGTTDDMESNSSTFMVEMAETSFILESCTPRSLVFIDELGRGTASDEGSAIAWSVSEEIIARRAYCCFATHYHHLNVLQKLYPNVRCQHMSAVSGSNSVRLHYKLLDGPFPIIEMYGIKTAAMCGFPPEVIISAKSVYKQLSGSTEITTIVEDVHDANHMKSALVHQLQALLGSGLNEDALRRQLQLLREKCIVVQDTP